jgi:hypothetical protein
MESRLKLINKPQSKSLLKNVPNNIEFKPLNLTNKTNSRQNSSSTKISQTVPPKISQLKTDAEGKERNVHKPVVFQRPEMQGGGNSGVVQFTSKTSQSNYGYSSKMPEEFF